MEYLGRGAVDKFVIRNEHGQIEAVWNPVAMRFYKSDGSIVPCLSAPSSEALYLMSSKKAEEYLAAFGNPRSEAIGAA